MRRYVLLLILILAAVTLISGCKLGSFLEKNSENTKSPVSSGIEAVSKDTSALTLEKVKEKYKTENLGEIVQTYDYKSYILVKYVNENSRQCFDLYNLKTGDRDILVEGIEAEIFNFSSGDNIVLKSNGVNEYSGQKGFPYYMVFTRIEEITGSVNDFHMERRELYKPINEEEEFGVKRDGMLNDLKVNLRGFEIEFTNQPGKEAEYNAGNVTIQAMKTFYDSTKNQFLVELLSTTVNPELIKKTIGERNRFINSIEVREKGSNSLIIVNLKATCKYYTVELEQDEFPWARFIFRESIGF